MRSTLRLVMLLTCAVCCGAAPAWSAEAAVPVTKVTAFSSGVAYFEHNGQVADEVEVLLKFKTEQINDILKSLVVFDFGKGNVTGVNYASRDPLTRALKSFGVDLSGEPTLADLLKQIRGAEVVVATPEAVKGKILGVETKTKRLLPSNTLIQEQVLNLLTDGGIKAIALDSISGLTLSDAKLNAELNKALALMVESRDSGRKAVTINFTGKGKRAVRIGYISEAPIWKTSYRLVLDPEKNDQLFLQGWAIVENTSDADWEKVDLTLVSGRPISFIQDLYTPLYLPRPVVQPELYASLRPQMYEEGLAEQAKQLAQLKSEQERARRSGLAKAGPRPSAARAPAQPAGRALADRARRAEKKMDLTTGVSAAAQTGAVGEMFSYHIKVPVTLPRRKSAMLPIINQAVKGKKVSIYNASVLAKHPLNGLWLINDTGLSLLGGPITVFDGGTYAGDARIGNLSATDKRLLSYAIDLKVAIDPSSTSSNKITAVKINRGHLHITRKYTYKQTYVIKNKADKERTLVVEHPRRSGWKLVEPKEPGEKTPGVYRFEVKVPGEKTGKFEVDEERSAGQTVAILPASVGSLQWYTTSNEIPKKVRDAIAEAIKRKDALSAVQREIADLQRQITLLRREQGHIRANMGALSKTSTGYKRFEKKLLDLETKIETLQAKIEDLQAKEKVLRKALEDYLSTLNID